MSCLYLEEEDITYQVMLNGIWKIKLGVKYLDESRMRAEVMELFEEKDL